MCVYAYSDPWPYASRTMRNTFFVGHAGSTTAHCAGWGSTTNTWSRGITGRRSAWGSATSSTGSFASVLHSIVQQEHRTLGAHQFHSMHFWLYVLLIVNDRTLHSRNQNCFCLVLTQLTLLLIEQLLRLTSTVIFTMFLLQFYTLPCPWL